MGKHTGTVTIIAFDFIGPLPSGMHVSHTCSHTWARTHTQFPLFFYTCCGRSFSRGTRNQTLAPNGFRTVHVDCGCTVVHRRQSADQSAIEAHSSTLCIKIVSFHDCYRENTLNFCSRHLHFHRPYWRIFHEMDNLTFFRDNVLMRRIENRLKP